jgi:hypothetical protein
MSLETLIPYVNQVGFPIVAFFLMYYLASKTIKENTRAINELTLKLKK